MGIRFAIERAADGRYNYSTEPARAELQTLPRGLFATPEAAAEALTKAVQRAFDAGRPCADGECADHRATEGGCALCGAPCI